MIRTVRGKIVTGVAAALAAGGAGGAVAATQLGSPGDGQAIIDDAAKQLGVQPSALTAALKKALENRVDAAVAAGRLTKEQGDALKSRIEAGGLPFLGGGFGHRAGLGLKHVGALAAAATYLGLTDPELRAQLDAGKTLAQIATDKSKSVDGLLAAMKAAAQKELDAAVAAGRLTTAQEQKILAGLTQRLTDLVNGKKGARHERWRR